MFPVSLSTTRYERLSKSEKAQRVAGDAMQNLGRGIANTCLLVPNMVRKCAGKKSRWIPSYHAMREEARRAETLRARDREAELPVTIHMPRALDEGADSNANRPLLPGTGQQTRLDSAHREQPLRWPLPATNREMVSDVLGEMGLDSITGLLPPDIGPPDYKMGQGPLFNFQGLALLAAYYQRKYGTDIQVVEFENPVDPEDLANLSQTQIGNLASLIEEARKDPAQGDVRRAFHFVGGKVRHSHAAVYVREVGEDGAPSECVYWFDSRDLGEEFPSEAEKHLAVYCWEHGIPMWANVTALQRDWYSCHLQAMKTCVTMTRRDGDDEGSYLIPKLIPEFRSNFVSQDGEVPSRRVKLPTKIFRMQALPEIARMAQSRLMLNKHLSESNVDSKVRPKRKTTLRDVHRDLEEKPRNEHYAPNKVVQYVQNIEIERWNRAIEKIAKDRGVTYGDREKLLFARLMHKRLRGFAASNDTSGQ
jgi:hypothetical protein